MLVMGGYHLLQAIGHISSLGSLAPQLFPATSGSCKPVRPGLHQQKSQGI